MAKVSSRWNKNSLSPRRMINKAVSGPLFIIFYFSFLHVTQVLSFAMSSKSQSTGKIDGSSNYHLGHIDLSQQWRHLVENGRVSVETNISNDGDDEEETIKVKYGVKLVEGLSENYYLDFVEQQLTSGDDDGINRSSSSSKESQRLKEMNEILKESRGHPIVRSLQNFVVQLQLVRTIRPPPSAGFVPEMTSATPPPYCAETDSFVMEGPLSLFQRPLVGSLHDNDNTHTAWDIYHNVSPVDVRGHFLLIPSLSNKDENWREQRLLDRDCMDLCHLARHMTTNLVIVYNSVGAGASQNHIHCHVWPNPPLALTTTTTTTTEENNNQEQYYAVLQAKPFSPIKQLGKHTHACIMDFPCNCIRLESSDMSEIGLALSTIIRSLKESWNDAPHNVAWFRIDEQTIRVYVFCRSRQQSPDILPYSKLGASEMLGLFHVKTMQDLDELATATPNYSNPMEQSLKDVSLEPKMDVWESLSKVLDEVFILNVE